MTDVRTNRSAVWCLIVDDYPVAEESVLMLRYDKKVKLGLHVDNDQTKQKNMESCTQILAYPLVCQ
jgi:hypothetical protein